MARFTIQTRLIVVTSILFLAVMLVWPQVSNAADVSSAELPEQRRAELLNLLLQDCGSCHGLRMKGGLGPALLPSTLVGKPAEVISAIILDGRPGTAMPAWRPLISPDEALWLATQLLQEELQ